MIKRRKLIIIAEYLATGRALNAMISIMREVEQALTVPVAATGAAPLPGVIPDLNGGAPRVYPDPLPDFSGDAISYKKDWERKAGATIKQTTYKGLLANPAVAGNAVEEAQSKELFNMILSSVAGGHALNAIEKARNDNQGIECGYKAWKALKDWYMDPNQKDLMIQHWETKLGDISLDKDSSANEYINNVEMYVRKLTKLGENWNDDKMVREFKAGVHDEDYGDIEVRVHSGTFAQLIEVRRGREQDLDCNASL